ncbi:MAG: RNA-guided endonuclease TnpB family protein [Infirmifilum sp.]
MGDEGFLTLTVGVRVSPEPEVVELLKRYRSALWHSIRAIHGHVVRSNLKRAPSLSTTHRLLYNDLREGFGLPSRIAIDCYREALAIYKSWLNNRDRGRLPTPRKLRMWLTHGQGYRIRDGFIEIIGGIRLKIVGWDRRYDSYENREARLVFRGGKMFLMVVKRIPKPEKIKSSGVLAVDVNEKKIVFGNSGASKSIDTPVGKALHYKRLAEELQRKYSNGKYRPWLARRGIRERIKSFDRKARNAVEDWARKTALEIVREAERHSYAVAREGLNGLVESLRKLPKDHRVKLMILSYKRLGYWIDWQASKHGVPVVVVDPRNTSSTCPRCGSKLRGSGYRRLRCPRCGFEADRDFIALLNIEKKALQEMGGALTPSTAPQMKDVNPNRCRGTSPPRRNPRPSGRGGGQRLRRRTR